MKNRIERVKQSIGVYSTNCSNTIEDKYLIYDAYNQLVKQRPNIRFDLLELIDYKVSHEGRSYRLLDKHKSTTMMYFYDYLYSKLSPIEMFDMYICSEKNVMEENDQDHVIHDIFSLDIIERGDNETIVELKIKDNYYNLTDEVYKLIKEL